VLGVTADDLGEHLQDAGVRGRVDAEHVAASVGAEAKRANVRTAGRSSRFSSSRPTLSRYDRVNCSSATARA